MAVIDGREKGERHCFAAVVFDFLSDAAKQ
jgi:hypothetical protein